ncbi:MAG: GNAT family N-acetyltransferase [Caldisericia bacterium]
MNIEKLDIGNLSENEWNEIHEFTVEIFSELYPLFSVPTLESVKRDFMDTDDSCVDEQFVIRDNVGIIAKSRIVYEKPSEESTEDDLKHVFMDIRVRKDKRRNGIGSLMLTDLLGNKFLPRHKEAHFWAKIDAGHEFCKKLGGKSVREIYVSNLLFKEVDWEEIRKINQTSRKKSDGISTYITEDVDDKTQPEYVEFLTDITEELTKYYESSGFNRERFVSDTKKSIKERKEQGSKSYLSWARDDGKLVGFSELTHEKGFPERVRTRMTGVSKDYRGKGLCKRMKTDLLFYVKVNHPEVKIMTTDNDRDNKVMRGINDLLGFVPEKPLVSYRYDVTELKARMGV